MDRGGRVVVTGARGYIGSALVPFLRARGYTVRCVSRSSSPSRGDPADGTEYMTADLRRAEAWQEALSGVGGLVHLASRTDLRAAEADEAEDSEINVQPLKALMAACERQGGAVLPAVFASTATIFGDRPALPANETTPDNPLSVYDRHKLAGERILAQATRSGIMSGRSLRLANVYGLTDDPAAIASVNPNRGILNAMMIRAAKGQALTVFGTGDYLRDFIHLDDVLAALTAALEMKVVASARPFVIASGEAHRLLSAFRLVADEAEELTGRRVDVCTVAEPADLHPSERRNFQGSSALFRSETGWIPKVSLQTGIRRFLRQAVVHDSIAAVGR
jgi:nucleoside-diphosphate-sugar epimerase